jgi:hypothetical protein
MSLKKILKEIGFEKDNLKTVINEISFPIIVGGFFIAYSLYSTNKEEKKEYFKQEKQKVFEVDTLKSYSVKNIKENYNVF